MSEPTPTRAELLEAVEDANDALAEGLDWANQTASHGEMRPSTHIAYKRMEDAHAALSKVDPTRSPPDEGEPIHCHNCASFAEVQDGRCSNCGASRDEFSTPSESAERFRATVDAVTDSGDGE